MHANELLHQLLSSVMHMKRLKTLKLLVWGLLSDKKLSTTYLGRSIKNEVDEKHNIKRSDRFLSNKHLYKERTPIYKAIISQLIPAYSRPWIIVDWSHVPNTERYILRAALVAKGRALPLYEAVYSKKQENNPKVHQRFLALLKKMLPEHCTPIMVTDAGFCNPWFKAVKAHGWDYVGRVRGKRTFRLGEDKTWHSYKNTGKKATEQGIYLGEGTLAQTNSLCTHFYLIKLPKKYRVALNKLRKKSHYKSDIEHSKSANEPWLLVSSLNKAPSLIIKIYAYRMTIEEGFRDLKSSKYGFSFEKAHSTKIPRIQILLMIAMLAAFIAYFIGWIAEKNLWHYKFQANSIKNRRVLSLFYLGKRILKKKWIIPINLFFQALTEYLFELNAFFLE